MLRLPRRCARYTSGDIMRRIHIVLRALLQDCLFAWTVFGMGVMGRS
jgi:hypothetical protein